VLQPAVSFEPVAVGLHSFLQILIELAMPILEALFEILHQLQPVGLQGQGELHQLAVLGRFVPASVEMG
jgi:hypothetical protein